MNQRNRLFLVLLLVFCSTAAFAQAGSSEVGVSVVSAALDDTTFLDPEGDVTIDFDQATGFGVSFNHFWTPAFSTELALQEYSAEMTIAPDDFPSVNAGDLDVTSLTAMGQLHFNRAGRFSVFVGGGLARISGEFELDEEVDPDDQTITLDSEVTWAGAVGANFKVTDRISIGGELKYIPWEAVEEGGDEDEDALDVNPLAFSAGVRFRF